MAVHRGDHYVFQPTVSTLRRRIYLCGIAGVVLIIAIQLLAGFLLDSRKGKMQANQIVSPWDKAAVPAPLIQPSHVAAKPIPVVQKPKLAEDQGQDSRHYRRWRGWHRHGVRHASTTAQ